MSNQLDAPPGVPTTKFGGEINPEQSSGTPRPSFKQSPHFLPMGDVDARIGFPTCVIFTYGTGVTGPAGVPSGGGSVGSVGVG